MKKTIILSVILLLAIFSFYFKLLSAPANFVPRDALWRIDLCPDSPPEAQCDWYQVSNYGDWGQGQCSIRGNTCHCWDWITWWFGIVWHPAPPEGWDSIYGDGSYIPTYNPNTGIYE